MRIRYFALGLGLLDLAVLVVGCCLVLHLPQGWFLVAFAISFLTTVAMLMYLPEIQVVVFPLLIWIDIRVVLAIQSANAVESQVTLSIAATYGTAFGLVVHLTAVALLLIINLLLVLWKRSRGANHSHNS